MPTTKKLLSITNLKKYFPVAKSSIFQKTKLYVRANEDITLDIYEGETLGIVGESGCGKSTLGRVLLQLYTQTAGCTLYYGKTIEEVTPKYVRDTIVHDKKYRKKLQKAHAHAEAMQKKVDEAGGEDKADFYTLQDANIARCEEETALSNIVKILGGFYAKRDKEGMDLLLKQYEAQSRRNEVQTGYTVQANLVSHLEDELDDAADAKKSSLQRKLDSAQSKLADIKKNLDKHNDEVDAITQKLDAVRAKYADDEEFRKYEAMRDNGIDLARLSYREMRILRKDLQIIFQDPYSSLNPRFTVGQIIEEGLTTHKHR